MTSSSTPSRLPIARATEASPAGGAGTPGSVTNATAADEAAFPASPSGTTFDGLLTPARVRAGALPTGTEPAAKPTDAIVTDPMPAAADVDPEVDAEGNVLPLVLNGFEHLRVPAPRPELVRAPRATVSTDAVALVVPELTDSDTSVTAEAPDADADAVDSDAAKTDSPAPDTTPDASLLTTTVVPTVVAPAPTSTTPTTPATASMSVDGEATDGIAAEPTSPSMRGRTRALDGRNVAGSAFSRLPSQPAEPIADAPDAEATTNSTANPPTAPVPTATSGQGGVALPPELRRMAEIVGAQTTDAKAPRARADALTAPAPAAADLPAPAGTAAASAHSIAPAPTPVEQAAEFAGVNRLNAGVTLGKTQDGWKKLLLSTYKERVSGSGEAVGIKDANLPDIMSSVFATPTLSADATAPVAAGAGVASSLPSEWVEKLTQLTERAQRLAPARLEISLPMQQGEDLRVRVSCRNGTVRCEFQNADPEMQRLFLRDWPSLSTVLTKDSAVRVEQPSFLQLVDPDGRQPQGQSQQQSARRDSAANRAEDESIAAFFASKRQPARSAA